MTIGKYLSYAKGPLIFISRFPLFHISLHSNHVFAALLDPVCLVLLPSTDLGMLHNILDNWLAKQLFLSVFETAPPEWEQKIQNTYLSIHDNLFWECKASGKPNPLYTWLKNGERLNPEVRIYVDIENSSILLGKFCYYQGQLMFMKCLVGVRKCSILFIILIYIILK